MATQRWSLRGWLAMALIGLAVVVVGCGGGSSSTSSSTAVDGSGTDASAQFLKPKGKNTIVKFGEEGSEEEREAVSVVVVESLKAREAGDFKIQCESLNVKGIKAIPGANGRQDCPTALKEFAEPLSGTAEARKDTLSGSIDALRVKGDQGYALFHGTDGKNYAVPLEKENGAWKLSSVQTTEI